MDDPYAVGRRGFLKTGAGAAAATAIACGGPGGRWRALEEHEAKTLAAACDRIIPPDQDPGAADAGVVTFIDRQLATSERDTLATWRAGIRGLDASARRRLGRPFAELPADAQTALLQDLERGAVEASDWPEPDPVVFFSLLREHTMMGFYGDPRHGGNKDRVAWRMLGLADPPIRGRLHETAPQSPSPAKG
jgi:gluconate 2-dehydrogenase gamma chain